MSATITPWPCIDTWCIHKIIHPIILSIAFNKSLKRF